MIPPSNKIINDILMKVSESASKPTVLVEFSSALGVWSLWGRAGSVTQCTEWWPEEDSRALIYLSLHSQRNGRAALNLHYRGTEASMTLKEGATEVNHRDLWNRECRQRTPVCNQQYLYNFFLNWCLQVIWGQQKREKEKILSTHKGSTCPSHEECN